MLASVLLLCIFAVYLATQIEQWLRLTQSAGPTGGGEQLAGNPAQPDLQRLELLFGSSAASADQAPPAAASGLTLRGSFVHAQPQRSSAIIQPDGQPPRLYWQGEELESGVSLHTVQADRVQILRNGRIETLHFPSMRSAGALPDEPPVPAYAEEQPAAEQQDEETRQMQQQMEALRQQLEEAVNQSGDQTSDYQPMEDD